MHLCPITGSRSMTGSLTGRLTGSFPRVVVPLASGEDVVIVRGTAEDLGVPVQVPEVVAALSAKYTGQGDQQYPARCRPCFRRGLRRQGAVGNDVATGRLRGLTAPLDGMNPLSDETPDLRLRTSHAGTALLGLRRTC